MDGQNASTLLSLASAIFSGGAFALAAGLFYKLGTFGEKVTRHDKDIDELKKEARDHGIALARGDTHRVV